MPGLTDDKLKKLLCKKNKSDLIQWLIEQADDDDQLQSALFEFVAPQVDVKTLISELRKTITTAWAKTRSSKTPWKLARPIATALEPVLPALEQIIERGHAVEAEKVLKRFIKAAEKGFDHVDDSYGLLSPICKDAVSLWGKAWVNIEPRDPAALADMICESLATNGYGLRDDIIRDFADALEREGLLELKQLFEEQYQVSLADPASDKWAMRDPLHPLAELADALHDVDMYIDVQRRGDMFEAYSIPIARRLLDADRPDEALAYLDQGDETQRHFHGEKDDRFTLRCKILKALGRGDEVRDLLWKNFTIYLSNDLLNQYLEMLPPSEHAKAIDEAVALAENHFDTLKSVLFFKEQNMLDRAAKLVVDNPGVFEERYYGTLLGLVECFEEKYPAATWVLYRALILEILDNKRAKAYGHASDYLAQTQTLASRAGIEQNQQQLMGQLRQSHGRKYSFWNRFEGEQ